MNTLGGLPNLAEVLTPTFIWALLAVGLVIVVCFSIAAYKTVNEPVHVVTPCSINGHHYTPVTGWRCTTCGADVVLEGKPPAVVKERAASMPPTSTIERWLMGGRGR